MAAPKWARPYDVKRSAVCNVAVKLVAAGQSWFAWELAAWLTTQGYLTDSLRSSYVPHGRGIYSFIERVVPCGRTLSC